jgi:replication factor A1
MTTQDLIDEIQSKNSQISQSQILEQLETERTKTDGLLSDETLLRLIAAKLGIQVSQTAFQPSNIISSGRLFAGLYDVNVAGRLIAVFPVKVFSGEEKSGKFATLMIGDNDGLLRVVLWNEKTELIEKGELTVGQTVRLLHGYTRTDRYGKTELHLGTKSLIELDSPEKTPVYQPLEQFTTKISSLNSNSGNVHLTGVVKAVFGKTGFTRNNESDGIVMRFALRDDSGETTVVVWNEKVEELEKLLRESVRLLLVNARVKEAKGGAVEVHVDSTTCISAQ